MRGSGLESKCFQFFLRILINSRVIWVIEWLLLGSLGFLLVIGLFLHHGLSLGLLSDKESIYSKTIVSKMYSAVLSPTREAHFCPRLKKHCSHNDHLGCRHFKTFDLKSNKVVCDYDDETASARPDTKKMVEKAGNGGYMDNKISTDIDKLAMLAHKHKKLILDAKLAKHLNMKPKTLYNYISCLEKYNFIRTYMDPLNGMTIVWHDKSDLISNGYSQGFIRDELQNRKKESLYHY